MLDVGEGDAGAALRALEEATAVLVVTQQVVRRGRGAVTVGTENVGHSRISR